MHCLIVANGPPPSPDQLRFVADKADLVIAADGGAAHALAAGLYPDVVIGDLDSVTPALLDELRAAEVRILKFPIHKNETDLELALAEAVKRGASEVTIIASVGNRLDQTLGNLFLMTLPLYQAIPMRTLTATEEAFVARERAVISGEVGDIVSLIPLTPRVTGIYTHGLEYPLEDGVLHFGPTLGISNQLREAQAEVTLKEGLLLVVHEWQHPPHVRPAPTAKPPESSPEPAAPDGQSTAPKEAGV